MVDPATGAFLSTTAGSLTLVNAIVKICQDQKENPKDFPPSVAQLVAALPAAALKTTDDLINEIKDLKKECREADINLDLTLDKLWTETKMWQRKRRGVLKKFQGKVDSIASELSRLFDDVVSVSDCADRQDIVARSFEASLEQKRALRKDLSGNIALGVMLDKLQEHAEHARAQLGDLNRKKR